MYRMHHLWLFVLFAFASVAQAESVYIEDLTWQEVRSAIQAGKVNAIIYTGSTEQNGPHMAIGKHIFIAHYVAGRIAEKLGDALVYPTLPFAPTGSRVTRTAHMRFPGSVSIDAATFLAIVRQVAESALLAGFKNVFLMGDHGEGQDELGSAAKQLNAARKNKGVHVYYVPDLYFKEKEQMKEYLAKRNIPYDAHAGTDDTSEILFLDKEHKWIRSDKLALSTEKQEATTGVDGDPTKATAELGEMFIHWKVDAAVNQIRKLLSEHK